MHGLASGPGEPLAGNVFLQVPPDDLESFVGRVEPFHLAAPGEEQLEVAAVLGHEHRAGSQDLKDPQ